MDNKLAFLKDVELTELHTHLGFSVSPTMLWEMAHEQGLKLPTKNYWEFEKLVTMYETKPFEEYLMLYDLTEKIQSSPEALFTAGETAVSGAYRKNNITTLELRFNPILRARGGERDLDHLIVYTLQGIERAMLKYPVRVGIILMMDRRFTHHENEAIVKKAIKYHTRGVIGVDLAGPNNRNDSAKLFKPIDIADIVDLAHNDGLGVTVHTGEATDVNEMWEVVKFLKPNRIGHGIACIHDSKLMQYLAEHEIVLETCPTSNLNTRLVRDFTEMKQIYRTLIDHKVPFTINTDGPEMQKISLRGEYEKLLVNNILSEPELLKANEIATKSTFIDHKIEKGKTYFI
jgi:adenosine deaminase